MSIFAIQQYHTEIEKLRFYGGTTNEMSVRSAFSRLLDHYAHGRDLKLVHEVSFKTKSGKIIRPDGTLKDMLRLDHGYWESKDGKDNINEEIRKKFNKGYPFENILFEDSRTAILFQNSSEVLRVPMSDGEELDKLLNLFVRFEREEVKKFHNAIDHFKQDIPKVTLAIHQVIDDQKNNPEFKESLATFYLVCQQAINSSITMADVQEMLVQHILSADIFNTIFDEPHFHQENNIARELNRVIDTFFIGSTRRSALNSIKHYYDTINATAASIADHHEKQKFLKVVYENFYKAYNPKAADRLGIVYTPNEVVRFMIEGTEFLLNRHFNKALSDKNVEILDPATGTGTFLCDIIDHLKMAGPKKLEYKYKHELHANEVAILPYYIANLNIEYTFKQATGNYEEFENLCFVDTLDNTGFAWHGKQADLFGLSTENVARIKKQNNKKISVIIGNPPYNSNQQNENDNNKNRAYPIIDKRIKDTFIKYSKAQKTKMYDMFARFYRWSFDRLEDNGLVAFVTNRSFIDKKTFDGFRKAIQNEFDSVYIIDTKSDVRANPKLSGSTHNVFGIQAGVAIMFLVKKKVRENSGCKIHYTCMDEYWRKEEKLQWLIENPLQTIEFDTIEPDRNNNWVNLTDNDFDTLIPLCSKNVKTGKGQEAIFKEFTIGSNTARDEWVYDFAKESLKSKVNYFVSTYNKLVKSKATYDNNQSIKWTRGLKQKFDRKQFLEFNPQKIVQAYYRPFVKKYLYHSIDLIEMPSLLPRLTAKSNLFITFSGSSHSKPFQVLIVDNVFSFDFLEKTSAVPLNIFDSENNSTSNITDWALKQFQTFYKSKNITKLDIFNYVYAVLNNPGYQKQYEVNLKRDFPKIPFYKNFGNWVNLGKVLIELHLNFESLIPYKLSRKEVDNKKDPQPLLKVEKNKGIIYIDENTELHGLPPRAWDYRLGNRSAIEWILDQVKEKKMSEAITNSNLNTYRFNDHKEDIIDLIKKICTLSIKTVDLLNQKNTMI